MRTVLFTACLLLAITGFSRWENLVNELADSATQQIPQTIAAMMSERFGGGARATQPGQEKIIAANLREALRSLHKDQLLRDARVELKQVRYVVTNAPTPDRPSARSKVPVVSKESTGSNELDEVANTSTGYYVAALQYDLMSPLTMETGAMLLTAACSCGVAQVKLSDGYDVVKTFRCPDLKR